jgi:hypothetical protein
VEEVLAGHDAEIFLRFIVVQTYQALVRGIRGLERWEGD